MLQKALEFKLGARGLRSICEVIMMDAMFELPSKEDTKEMTMGIKYARAETRKGKPETTSGCLMNKARAGAYLSVILAMIFWGFTFVLFKYCQRIFPVRLPLSF